MLSNTEKDRYSRHTKLEGFGLQAQEKLKSAKVLVVGAGGLGSPALLYLAAAGVGCIGVVDGDRVSLSNLQRQVLFDESVIGKNTVEALQSGTIYGFAGQVDGLVDRITTELLDQFGTRPTVIATGGLAPLIIGVSETIDHHEPDLTLIGLRLIHERNS